MSKATDKRVFELHAAVCRAFAHPKRIEILSLLRDGDESVGELAHAMGAAPANVSQHLAILRQQGAVVCRRDGQTLYYRIANSKITAACNLMREVLMEQIEERERLARDASGGHPEPS